MEEMAEINREIAYQSQKQNIVTEFSIRTAVATGMRRACKTLATAIVRWHACNAHPSLEYSSCQG
jgi:hypothetical protein